MNNIIFQKLVIQNFKSFGTPVEFDFSKHHGLNYIYGVNLDIPGTSNGAGKSALFDALIFALYGKTFHNNNNQFIPNRTITDKKHITDVCIEFLVNDNKYKIRTYIKHLRKPYTINCQLFKNDEDITKASSKETRKFIEEQILFCDYDLFKRSVVLSSGDANNFFKMTKQQKRDYIEDIFDLTIFGKMFTIVKKDINVLDKELIYKQTTLQQQKDNVREFSIKDAEFTDNKIIKIKQLKSEIENIKSEIKKIEVAECTQDKKKYEGALVKVKEQISTLSEHVNKATVNISKFDNLITSSERELSKHREILELVCDDCNKKIVAKYNIVSYEDKIKDSISQKDINEKNKVLISKKLELLQIKKTELKTKIQGIEKIELSVEKQKWEKNQLKQNAKAIVETIKTESVSENPFTSLIETYNKEIAENEIIVKNLLTDKTELDIIRHTVSEEGAKKYIIKDLIDILNQLIHKYLEEMGAEFTCIFDAGFGMTFLTNTGECEYSSFSAGERQRINIATLLAFRDILMNGDMFECNIFVLDELLDANVDSYCIQSLINILNRQTEKNTVYIISHREAVSPEDFDNIIEIQKQNSITTIAKDSQGEIK